MLELKSAVFTVTAVFIMIRYHIPAACNVHTPSLFAKKLMLYLLYGCFKMFLCPLVSKAGFYSHQSTIKRNNKGKEDKYAQANPSF